MHFIAKTLIYCVVGCTRETAYKIKIKASNNFSGKCYILSLCKSIFGDLAIHLRILMHLAKKHNDKTMEIVLEGSDHSYLGNNNLSYMKIKEPEDL
ncbi:hypothetical protein H5410_004164 [Solanum commersonii]|uniref:Uncharacterized protein n=1 Tax=Solanum commersonii TaxID=4109 RepID=A0A9J6B7P2_SOLCO|nr:hypothetical protein H5410_004164 [Solanum commersonii]